MTSSPTVIEGKVYVGNYNGSLICLNVVNGSLLWKYSEFGGNDISSPTVAYGKVYFCQNDDIYCRNAENGTLIWGREVQYAHPVYSTPAVLNGKVYIASTNAQVYCFNASTGSTIWNYTTGYGIRSSPAVFNEKVYIGSGDGYVYCLDADTGSRIWQFGTGDKVRSSPAIADGKLYVGSLDKKVYCLNATNGIEIWNLSTGASIESSPAVADGTMCIASGDGKLYMFRDATKLELNISGGLGVKVTLKNIGAFDATNISLHISITGGFLKKINSSLEQNIASLQPNDTFQITQSVFGLGSVIITATANASNAEQVQKVVRGFVILFFAYIR
jgi:outer membrane protein assembly factor BamB